MSDRNPTDNDVLAELEHRLRVSMRTCVPAIVVTFAPATVAKGARVKVQAAQKLRLRNGDDIEIPILPSVPVYYQRGGGFSTEFPLAPTDKGWLLVSDRAIDRWMQTGVPSAPRDGRTHAIDEAMFLPGGFPDPAHSLPTDPPVDPTALVIRHRASGARYTVRPGEVEAEAVSIKLGATAVIPVALATPLIAAIDALLAAGVLVENPLFPSFSAATTAWTPLKAAINAAKSKAE